jgi:hypothetical protein
MPQMLPLDSEMASHAGYDAETQELHITFRDGKTHAYSCSPAQWQAFQAASSKGRWFHANIDRNKGRRVE